MKYREETTGSLSLLRNPLQGKSITRFYYSGVKWRKCCTVASHAATQPIIEHTSSNSRHSSNDKPLISNFVPKTCATSATADDNRSTRISDKINDNNAPENPSSAPPYRNGRRMNPSVAPISFCTLMASRRAKILRRTRPPPSTRRSSPIRARPARSTPPDGQTSCHPSALRQCR